MNILLHDYAGHPFQVQLSRSLARRGHSVVHLYAGYNNTPHGALARKPEDPPGFQTQALYIRSALQKYSFLKRWLQEREYGRLLAKTILDQRPDVVISANTPLDAQSEALAAAHQAGAGFVFWLQDFLGLAANLVLRQKLGIFGAGVGRYYIQKERSLLRRSERVVSISEDYRPYLCAWGVDEERLVTIPNWGVLSDIPQGDKANAWAGGHGLADKIVLLYSGSLGMKHNPGLLLDLALDLRGDGRVRVVVASEGLGADWLREQKERHALENLVLLPYQPIEQFPDLLAAGDVLLSILEAEAGVFSVPSKILSYLCAGRALLVSLPPENLAARVVEASGAGWVVPSGDGKAWMEAARGLVAQPELRAQMGANARRYAETTFDIEKISDAFESLIQTRI